MRSGTFIYTFHWITPTFWEKKTDNPFEYLLIFSGGKKIVLPPQPHPSGGSLPPLPNGGAALGWIRVYHGMRMSLVYPKNVTAFSSLCTKYVIILPLRLSKLSYRRTCFRTSCTAYVCGAERPRVNCSKLKRLSTSLLVSSPDSKRTTHNPGFRFRRIPEHRDPGGTTRRHEGVQSSERWVCTTRVTCYVHPALCRL